MVERRLAALALALTIATPLCAQTWTGVPAVDSANVARTAWRAASAALRGNDQPTAQREVERAVAAWPTQEAYLWGSAIVAAVTNDTMRVISALQAYARMGFGRDAGGDPRVKPFLADPRAANVVASLAANRAPLTTARTWTEFGDSAFWPEGIDVDATTGHAFVTSIRQRTIAEVSREGRVLRTLPSSPQRIGAIFGVRVDARRGVLWATTSGTRVMAGYASGDSAIASLLRIRLSDGVVERRWDLPVASAGHTLGDVALAPSGDVFMTDSNEPVLYRLRPDADTLERYTHPLFRSLQGMAPTPDGRAVYVADWTHGLLRVDLGTGAVTRLADAPNSSSLGCDGIALHGNSIIAVQNGSIPNRVMRFTLDATGTRITGADVLDRSHGAADAPTIGAIVGDEFVFVANSQWEKYDANGARLANTTLTRPILRAIPLQAAPAPAFSTSGAFIAMSVPDLDASVRWYTEKFGMRVVFSPPPNDGYTVKVVEGGGLTLELMHNARAVPLRTAAPSVTHTTLVHGIFKAGLVVDDFDRTIATLRERGVDIPIGPFPARDGQPANAIIRDNAGNLIQFFGKSR